MVTRHCGDHFVMYRNIESLCSITGTNMVLQVNLTSKKKQNECPCLIIQCQSDGHKQNQEKRNHLTFVIPFSKEKYRQAKQTC